MFDKMWKMRIEITNKFEGSCDGPSTSDGSLT